MLAGEVEEVAAGAVGQDKESLLLVVVEGVEVDERWMGYRAEHVYFALEAELDAFFVCAASGTVLDNFDGHELLRVYRAFV